MNISNATPKNPYVNIEGTKTHDLSKIIYSSYEKSLNDESNLPNFVLNMHGMSGRKYRHLINNIVSLVENPRYLEIGSWQGSTASSAIYGNTVTCTCIDNWSECGDASKEFNQNIKLCVSDNIKLNVYEEDFYKINYSSIGKHNIFLFDGPHGEQEQYDGIKLPYESLDDAFILIVDDWNWKATQNGTRRAIEDLNTKILYSMEILTVDGIVNTFPNETFETSFWHNGYYIAVCQK